MREKTAGGIREGNIERVKYGKKKQMEVQRKIN